MIFRQGRAIGKNTADATMQTRRIRDSMALQGLLGSRAYDDDNHVVALQYVCVGLAGPNGLAPTIGCPLEPEVMHLQIILCFCAT